MCQHPKELQSLVRLGRCDAPPPPPPPEADLQPPDKPVHADQAAKAEGRKPRKRPPKLLPTDTTSVKAKFDKTAQGQEFKLEQAFLQDYLKLTGKERFMIGHQLKDMVFVVDLFTN